jgi:hypothetical protein
LWQLPWSNQRKVLFWRLSLDGLPTSARMHFAVGDPCPCGGVDSPCPGRTHSFWTCPAARAVVAEVQRVLGPLPVLTREQIWLLRAPPGVHLGVWLVVALAALHSMWSASRSLMLEAPRARFVGPEAERLPHVAAQAVEAFWGFLREFAVLGRPPDEWRELLPLGSPFLHYPGALTGIRVNRV